MNTKSFGFVTVLVFVSAQFSIAQIQVTDSVGRIIKLPKPAHRIISLAPHITEQLFSIGAGSRIVGAMQHSDYPAAAKKIQRIGSYNGLDYERITVLNPELIITWLSGVGKPTAEKLEKMGYTVYIAEPKNLKDIAFELRNFGTLTGLQENAQKVSSEYLLSLNRLQQRYQSQSKIRVFYQIWHQPMMTVNKNHMISKIIDLCGGINIFAENMSLASNVDIESVIVANPQAIIASGSDMNAPQWLDEWKQWSKLDAVKNKHLFSIPPDIIQRHTIRLLQGALSMCTQLEQVRESIQ